MAINQAEERRMTDQTGTDQRDFYEELNFFIELNEDILITELSDKERRNGWFEYLLQILTLTLTFLTFVQ